MNNSEFVALSKFSFSSGGGASVADDSENICDAIGDANCGSAFDDAITGDCPGVAPAADAAAFVASATTTFFKRSILSLFLCLWCFCVCGVSVSVVFLCLWCVDGIVI